MKYAAAILFFMACLTGLYGQDLLAIDTFLPMPRVVFDDNGIVIQFIQPGRPMQNGFIERFNGSYRKEILDAYVFFELNVVRTLTLQWIEEYNNRRSHEGLGNATPREWLEKLKSPN